MARTIMDAMHDNLNTASVSNAIYEMMLDWRATVMLRDMSTKAQKPKLKIKRITIEQSLSRFFNVTQPDMRDMLQAHFFGDDR